MYNLKKISTIIFDLEIQMNIFDYDFYKNNNIHNEGLDIISHCLEIDKCWEPFQTEITKEILKDGKNIFIDVGTHLGYYSLIAAKLGNNVYSIDGSKKYFEIFLQNIKDNSIENIKALNIFIDNNFNIEHIVNINDKIKLIKCDIEGYEIEFVNTLYLKLENHTVENLILEISPMLRKTYPETILKIIKLGYNVYDIGLSPQRKLDANTTLSSLKSLKINFDNILDITTYINNFPEKQSNFLFSLENY